MSQIKLLDTYKWWKAQPQQLEAVKWLDQNLSKEQREEFQKLFRAKPANPQPLKPRTPVKSRTWLLLEWSGTYEDHYDTSFKALELKLMAGDKKVDSAWVLSGGEYAQSENFVHPADDWSGSLRPIPENVYAVGPVEDAGEGSSWGPGLGRWWVDLTPKFHPNNRSAIGIHVDANAAIGSEGSAGCICPFNPNDINRIIGWLRQQSRPKELVVNWGMGYLREKGVSVPK